MDGASHGLSGDQREGDFLPGLIVDRYGDTLLIQTLTAGMDEVKGPITEILAEQFDPSSIYERNDVAARREEGLAERRGVLYGDAPPDRLEILEGTARFWVDIKEGQKTGFYLDQRENHLLMEKLSRGKRILDCFGYTGGFSVHAGVGGAAEVTLIESSERALTLARENLDLNHLRMIPHRFLRGEAFDLMRTLEPAYDLVVLDPPPFAKKKSHILSAARGYKDLNLQAFRLLKPGGLLFTFSCSHHMSWDLFQEIVFSAALDAGRGVQIVNRMGHPVDHPFSVCHPEGEYLRGFVCRAL